VECLYSLFGLKRSAKEVTLTNMLSISSGPDILNHELPIAWTLRDDIIMIVAAAGIGK
jgi:hypothetical protein